MNEGGILAAGERAPDLRLRGVDGRGYVLTEALGSGPVLAAFFTLDCQTCQMSFVFWDRIHEAHAGEHFQFWAISLDAEAEAAGFVERSGVSFPVLIGDQADCAAGYGLVSTPSHFLIGRDRVIVKSHDAFDRPALNAMIATVAAELGELPFEIPAAEAPEFLPGCTLHV
jgi:peroxiredoxin